MSDSRTCENGAVCSRIGSAAIHRAVRPMHSTQKLTLMRVISPARCGNRPTVRPRDPRRRRLHDPPYAWIMLPRSRQRMTERALDRIQWRRWSACSSVQFDAPMGDLHGVDLVDPPLVPAAVEGSVQPHLQYLDRQLLRHHPLADRKHVGIVVPSSQLSRVQVPAEGGAYTLHAIRDHRFAVSGSADHYSSLRVAARNGNRDGMTEQGIIHRQLGVSPEILHFMSELGEPCLEHFLVTEARVVRSDCDAHLMAVMLVLTMFTNYSTNCI